MIMVTDHGDGSSDHVTYRMEGIKASYLIDVSTLPHMHHALECRLYQSVHPLIPLK